MTKPKDTERHRYGGTHYLPPRAGKRGPKKGVTYDRAASFGNPTKIDAARMEMERDHLKKLARAHCDKKYAKANPTLVRMIASLNDDMRAKLKRLYAAQN